MSQITKDGTRDCADCKSPKHVPFGHHSPAARTHIVLPIDA